MLAAKDMRDMAANPAHFLILGIYHVPGPITGSKDHWFGFVT